MVSCLPESYELLLTVFRDAPGVEVVQPGEEDLKLHVAKQFNQLQTLSFQKTAHCMRATHLKTQGVQMLEHIDRRMLTSTVCPRYSYNQGQAGFPSRTGDVCKARQA
jgi:hypothetical protein